jgi:hypothetical protein
VNTAAPKQFLFVQPVDQTDARNLPAVNSKNPQLNAIAIRLLAVCAERQNLARRRIGHLPDE